jgi:hypothetical protein
MLNMYGVLYVFIVIRQIVIYFDASKEVRFKNNIYIYNSIENNNVFIALVAASFVRYDQQANIIQHLYSHTSVQLVWKFVNHKLPH